MQLRRLALGIRFDFVNIAPDAHVQRLVFEELLSVLTLSDMRGLSLYGGTDPTAPGENIYLAVIMGGKLKCMRRIYEKLQGDTALDMYLCPAQPFLENNRLERVEGLTYFGDVGADGYLHGGDEQLPIRVSKARGRHRSVGRNIHILLAPSAMPRVSAMDAVKRLTIAARSSFPGVRILPLPLIAGEGCVNALVTATGGSFRHVTVAETKQRLTYGVLRGRIGVIEAQEDGYATGVAIRRALDEGLKRIYIMANRVSDGGMGCARALGVKFYDAAGELITAGKPTRVDAELLHPLAQGAAFVLLCAEKTDTLGALAESLLRVEHREAVDGMLDAADFERLLTGKALVITGGEDICARESFGERATENVVARCAKFHVPVVALTCCGWDQPELHGEKRTDIMGVVKAPLKPEMDDEQAGKVFDETVDRLFRFIRLGRDVEKIGAPKREPNRIRRLPAAIRTRLSGNKKIKAKE
ncbi:MAG: glycerate kinase [Eubacteriales bacterium]|nr:glycerate kinase [Eubacteriales bacterium]